jgi:hypothetical protein
MAVTKGGLRLSGGWVRRVMVWQHDRFKYEGPIMRGQLDCREL